MYTGSNMKPSSWWGARRVGARLLGVWKLPSHRVNIGNTTLKPVACDGTKHGDVNFNLQKNIDFEYFSYARPLKQAVLLSNIQFDRWHGASSYCTIQTL